MKVIIRTLSGIFLFGLLTVVTLDIVSASPDQEAETDSLDLLIAALNDAEEKGLLDEPQIPTLLISSLDDAREEGLLDSSQASLTDLLADWLIESVIAPGTGETPELVRARLSGRMSPSPLITINARSESPTRTTLNWSYYTDAATTHSIYRDDTLIATPPSDSRSYTDDEVNPNVRYEYKVVLKLEDGSFAMNSTEIVTPANPPYMAGPIDINERSFKLAIVDDLNPPGTEYRVTVSNDEGDVYISNWDTSRCRTFHKLRADTRYSSEVVARNMLGKETRPTNWIYSEWYPKQTHWYVQPETGNQDPWAIYKINEAAHIYGLTEAARLWLLSDMQAKFYRNEPDYGGYLHGAHVGNKPSWVVMHEFMHGFTEHWTGFPETCDTMNIYTFKRDVARFMLDFRSYDRLEEPNPLEDWRPFYNILVAYLQDPSDEGRDMWRLLEQGDYDELRRLYHRADTEIPNITAGKMSLIPPILRPYFQGFLVDETDTNWRDELNWYTRLIAPDKRLWDTVYIYHGVLAYSSKYAASPRWSATRIPPELRETIRNADRRILVDFINTLEDISCNMQDPCKTVWNSDFDFWTRYVEQNLHRARLYLEELSPDIGIELEQSNLEAVQSVLGKLAYPGDYPPDISALREYVNDAEGISDLQRAAFIQMIEVIKLGIGVIGPDRGAPRAKDDWDRGPSSDNQHPTECASQAPSSILNSRDALVALYRATNGPYWSNNANWLSDKPLGEWHGVEVDRLGEIISLDLGRNRLNGCVPAELGDLPHLESLSLWGNQLKGPIPTSLNRLHNLRQLFMHDNLLSGQLPPELVNLPELERLFVGGNGFTGCVPDGFEDTLDSDLSTLGLPTCDEDELSSNPPPFTLKAFSHSPTQISLTWSPLPKGITLLEVHRLGAVTVLLPAWSTSHTQDGLDPNTSYKYELKMKSPYGSTTSVHALATTLPYPPDP